jgi:hypothetical protein
MKIRVKPRIKYSAYIFIVLSIFILLASFSSFVIAADDQEPRGDESYEDYYARVSGGSGGGAASAGASALVATPSDSAARIQSFINDGYIIIKPVLELIVGTTAGGNLQESTIFFAKVLLLIIVFSLIFVILDKSGGNIFSSGWLKFLISFFVAILGVRFLNPELIEAIILPNQTFLVAVTAGLPFVLYYLAVSNFPSPTQRRLAWVFFSAIFTFIWIGRYEQLGNNRWIYPVAAVLGLLMIIFDGTFAKFRSKVKTEKLAARSADEQVKDLRRALVQLQKDYREGILGEDERENTQVFKRERNKILDKINHLRA